MHAAEEIGRTVPTTIAWNKVLADTTEIVLFAPRLQVYRSLFRIAIAGRLRPTASAEAAQRFSGVQASGNPYALTAEDLARGLRLGVQFADGRRAALERRAGVLPSGGPLEPGPLISTSRASSDEGVFDWEIVVTAIPQAGPVKLYYQWLDLGIGESMAEIDGDVLRDAADRSSELWAADHT
ncbi:hypothetical protein KDK95_14045 [Actinospica sp. MGRD01-02]|uniref:Uncharacterized protein n=1 Tax=Actinospica acidithermotolerans TaxID=2828514 RepID=A0A941E6V3_9ACTN|nr:hypothetical protein [Actinospica acidithermotolerans]MBR7827435.1 hypothetical protein [Actinospica acidithermotolerans]